MRWKHVLIPILALAFLALAIFAGRYRTGSPTSVAVQPSDLLRQAGADEILSHVHDLKSPLVLVNFWASWCEPCKVEFPHLLAMRERFAKDGLQLVLVSLDDVADRAAAETFLKQQKVDFQSFFKGDQPLSFVGKINPKWSGAIPMSLLFGKDGQVVDAWEGDTSLSEFESRVRAQLQLKGS